MERYDAVGEEVMSPGKHTIVVDFEPDKTVPGCPATVKLFVDGDQVAESRVERQIPMRAGTECFDVSQDSRSPGCPDYEDKGLFEFNGMIEHVHFEFGDFDEPTGMDRLEMATKMD